MSDGVMTQAQYARHRGCARQTVSVAVKKGRIRVEANGLIDPAVADAMWAANSKAPPPPKAPAEPSATSGRAAIEEQRSALKLKREQMEFDHDRGLLISRAEAEAHDDHIAAVIQSWCASLPGRLAQPIASQTGGNARAIRRTIAAEVATLQDQLAAELLTPGTTDQG